MIMISENGIHCFQYLFSEPEGEKSKYVNKKKQMTFSRFVCVCLIGKYRQAMGFFYLINTDFIGFSHNCKGIRKDYLKFALHNIKGWPSSELVAIFQMKQKRLQYSMPGQEIQKFSHMERLSPPLAVLDP